MEVAPARGRAPALARRTCAFAAVAAGCCSPCRGWGFFGSHRNGNVDVGALLWLLPVALPLLAAWPVAVWAGRPALGRALRRAGLLLTPEEVSPAPALQRAWADAWANAAPANQPYFKPMQLA